MDGLVQGGAVIGPLFNSGILIIPFYSTNLMIKLVTYRGDWTVPLTFPVSFSLLLLEIGPHLQEHLQFSRGLDGGWATGSHPFSICLLV